MQTKEFNEKLIEVLNDCEKRLIPLYHSGALIDYLQECLPYFAVDYTRTNINHIYHFLKQLFPNIREITLNTLASKGDEYSDFTDRFINFHKGKLLCQDLFDTHELTPRKVLMLITSKHVVWCIDYLDGKIQANKDKILEHFGDVLNYLLISYIAGEELN